MMCYCYEKIRFSQTEEFPSVGKHTYAPDKCRSPYQIRWAQRGVSYLTIQPVQSGTETIPI